METDIGQIESELDEKPGFEKLASAETDTGRYHAYLELFKAPWFQLMELGNRAAKIGIDKQPEYKDKYDKAVEHALDLVCERFKGIPGARELVSRDLFQMWLDREDTHNLLCPICKTKLDVIEHGRYQNLSEHCSNPNGLPTLKAIFGCPNEACDAHKDTLRWDSEGGYYGPVRSANVPWDKEYAFIDGNDGPFNSYERKANVKQDFRPKKTLLKIGALRVYLEGHREGNEQGDVVKKWWTWHATWKGQILGISMFWYCVKCFWRAWKQWRKNPTSDWFAAEIRSSMVPPKWDKRWWKLSSAWLFRNIFRSTWKQVSKPAPKI